MIAILFPISCSGLSPTLPRLKITILARPELHDPTRVVSVEGVEYVMFSSADWRLIRIWYLEMERSLKTACLALGGSNEECGTK